MDIENVNIVVGPTNMQTDGPGEITENNLTDKIDSKNLYRAGSGY